MLDEQNTLNPNQISGSIHSWDFAVGAQGAYFLGVTFSGKLHYGDRVLISRGGTDAFVAKLDPIQDKVAWIHHVGGPGDDSITKVKLDQSNNPTFVGLYSGKALLWESGPGSPLQVSVPKGSTNGVFVLSLLSQGVLHWARALGGGTKHEAPLVAVLSKTGTSALAYTATGLASTKQIPCGAKNLYNGQDALSAGVQTVVIQLDSKGDCAWARVIGGGPGEAVSTTDLSFLTGLGTVQSLQLFGSFAGKLTWGATTLQSVGGKDAFWLQFDSKGAPERSLLKQLGSKGDDVLEHSHQTRTIWDPKQGQFGNTLMIGSFRGPVTLGTTNLTHKGQRDAFLLEMSRDSPVWSMVFGGAGDERGAFLLRDRSTSRLFMAITFQEDLRLPNGVLLRSRGKRDIALIELDRTDRKVLWSAQLGGEEDEVPVAFRLTQNQGEIVLGFQTASRDLYIERQLFKTNAVGGSRALMWRVRP